MTGRAARRAAEPERMTPARQRVLDVARRRYRLVEVGARRAAGVSAGVVDGLVDGGTLELVDDPAGRPPPPPDPDHAAPALSRASRRRPPRRSAQRSPPAAIR